MTNSVFRFKSFALLLAIGLVFGIGGLFLNVEFGISFQIMRIVLVATTVIILGAVTGYLYKRDPRLFERPFLSTRLSPEQLPASPTCQTNSGEAEKLSVEAKEPDLAKLKSPNPSINPDAAR